EGQNPRDRQSSRWTSWLQIVVAKSAATVSLLTEHTCQLILLVQTGHLSSGRVHEDGGVEHPIEHAEDEHHHEDVEEEHTEPDEEAEATERRQPHSDCDEHEDANEEEQRLGEPKPVVSDEALTPGF